MPNDLMPFPGAKVLRAWVPQQANGWEALTVGPVQLPDGLTELDGTTYLNLLDRRLAVLLEEYDPDGEETYHFLNRRRFLESAAMPRRNEPQALARAFLSLNPQAQQRLRGLNLLQDLPATVGEGDLQALWTVTNTDLFEFLDPLTAHLLSGD